ncbi:hypothetical protein [Vulgatibacter sp.]|uniref:hypothetical protein n=1 Tax=Vulgatibacter sp. TaxID=1971226 RepID=UPI003566BF48
MLRAWCKLLLLIVGLGLFGLQAVAAEHHHALDEGQPSCAACILHQSPATRPPQVVELPLPAPLPPPLYRAATRDVDPPPALTPADVSPSTSPPALLQRLA